MTAGVAVHFSADHAPLSTFAFVDVAADTPAESGQGKGAGCELRATLQAQEHGGCQLRGNNDEE